MKHVLMIACLFTTISAFCQVEELDKRNGFKDIKLMLPISLYEGLEFSKELDDEPYPKAKLYTAKKGYYESIGHIPIHELYVKTYADSIYQIVVITDKNMSLYKGLKRAFGEPEYGYRSEKYHWTGKALRLTYTSHSKDKIEMVYDSFLMKKRLKEDKEDVIEAISEDF